MKSDKINLYALLFSILVLFSCGPSRKVTFNITQPAEITLPSDVNTILLVDRTKPTDEMLNILEGIFTGELPADDKKAAAEAMMSLKGKLDNSPRFNVRIFPERLPGNSMTATFPNALSWETIDSLCVNNNSEAVVCLEVFDSDFIVTNGARIKKRTEGAGKEQREVEYTEYYAQGLATVKMGIRTYYNNDKLIVDQQMISKNNTWETTGNSPEDAILTLISKSKANKYLAGLIGGDYAYKISPMYVSVSRQFYGKVKHIPEGAEGSRFADVNQWQEAIDAWKRGIAKAETKEAGKLAYNVAIGYEVLGEYGNALTTAREAYTKYGNKEAQNYVRILEYRIDEETRLKEQMK